MKSYKILLPQGVLSSYPIRMKYLFLLILASGQLMAQPLCERASGQNPLNYLGQVDSRISFKNRGGLFNGGVCWWHSRMQRSSVYLAEFKPTAAKPDSAEVEKILRDLKSMKKVVTIPGYADFKTFTAEHQDKVQSILEVWQREDGFINQQWLRGISGKSELEPDQMRLRMDQLFDQVQASPQPVWIMAQIKGITSHSFLVLDMQVVEGGYELSLVDSNHPLDAKLVIYQYGQRALKHPRDKYTFVPYLGFQKDFTLIHGALKQYCGRSYWQNKSIPVGEIEVGH